MINNYIPVSEVHLKLDSRPLIWGVQLIHKFKLMVHPNSLIEYSSMVFPAFPDGFFWLCQTLWNGHWCCGTLATSCGVFSLFCGSCDHDVLLAYMWPGLIVPLVVLLLNRSLLLWSACPISSNCYTMKHMDVTMLLRIAVYFSKLPTCL